MAYNYSATWLQGHRAEIAKLIELARQGSGVYRTSYADPSDAQKGQFKVNNILCSLARRHPDLAWVRERLRTRIEQGPGGETVLLVGHLGRMRGRRPKPVALATPSADERPELGILRNGALVVQADLNTISHEDFIRIQVRVREAKDLERLVMERPPALNEEVREYLFNAFDWSPDEWQIVQERPLIAERKGRKGPWSLA